MKNLIFLHGFPFNSSSWDPQISRFIGKFNVLAPDLRGHRDGPVGPGPWMIAHFADDLKALLDKHNIDKAVVCGLSMGGYIALHFAQQYPDRLEGLILCDTQAGADSNEAKDKRYATIQKVNKEGLDNFAQDFSKAVLCEKTLKEKPQIQKTVTTMIMGNKKENVALNVGALASRRDSTPFLGNITCPTLVLVGADDKVTPPDVNKKLADGIKGATFHSIEDAGHLSNLEQPDIFNRHLEAFLES